MVISRRKLLKAGSILGGSLLLPTSSLFAERKSLEHTGLFVGGGFYKGKPAIGVSDLKGKLIKTIEVPGRMHECLVRSSDKLVVIGRNPSKFAYELNLSDFTLQQIITQDDRFFCGHGAFDSGDDTLFTTEHDALLQRDLIVCRDATNGYKVLKEFALPGIGPHDIDVLPDQDTLVVAIGGILIDPKFPGRKLNIGSMESSLVYIDKNNGAVIQNIESPYQKLSLRHLSVSDTGEVWIAGQYQGFGTENIPLIASHLVGAPSLQFIEADRTAWSRQKQYIGSILIDSNSKYLYATSPRGDELSVWDVENRLFLRSVSSRDICALGRNGFGGIFAGTGKGSLLSIEPDSDLKIHQHQNFQWDNHAALLTL